MTLTMLRTATLGLALSLAALPLGAAEVETHVTDYQFAFEGPFGSYDTMQLQRGLQVYTEVCSGCHGLSYVAFRTIAEPGGPELPEDQMRAYAEMHEVFDQSLADGEGDYRPATPADRFPTSAMPGAPDLSLMAKARAGFHGPYGTGLSQLFNGMGGAEYVASLLAGYEEPPECAPEDFEGYYNVAFANGGYPEQCLDEEGHRLFPGSWIAMPPPLVDGQVEFADGARNDVEALSHDVAAFMMWTAEPLLNARKQAGLTGVLFLAVLAVLLYLTNKRVWSPVKAGGRPLGADQR
jgi:ubiquinol-cytochrome c reductase cytochrome c1 subunit